MMRESPVYSAKNGILSHHPKDGSVPGLGILKVLNRPAKRRWKTLRATGERADEEYR
jgi:hypothetical protein